VSGNERERGRVENILFLYIFAFHPFSCDRLSIYINKLQYKCNPSLNCNEQYKEEIGHVAHYGNQIIANQSTISNNISNIDSNH